MVPIHWLKQVADHTRSPALGSWRSLDTVSKENSPGVEGLVLQPPTRDNSCCPSTQPPTLRCFATIIQILLTRLRNNYTDVPKFNRVRHSP